MSFDPADYFASCEEKYHERLFTLHDFYINLSPGMSCKKRYGLPFYDYDDQWMFYLTVVKEYKNTVITGFMYAPELSSDYELEINDKKMVKHVLFPLEEEINFEALQTICFEAIELAKIKKKAKS